MTPERLLSPTLRVPEVPRVRSVSPALALTALIALATVVRLALALPRDIPRYLPDEYLYPQLARSLAGGDGVAVLGQSAALPALLEPILTAPLWAILGGTAGPIAATQALHALLGALVAIPVYLLARHVDLRPRTALLCSAAAVLSPGLFFVAHLSADVLGLLLALTAVAAAVRALSTRTRSAEIVALIAIGLATFARLQYVLLFLGFVLGILAAERSVGRAVRGYPLTTAVMFSGIVAAPIARTRVIGRYDAIAGFVPSGGSAHWLFTGGFLLVAGCGVAIVPGALAWTAQAVTRPASRARAGLAAMALSVVFATLAVASVYTVETASDRFLERYLLVAAPLAAVAFACWIDERRPAAWIAITGALGLVIVAMRLTLSQFTVGQGVADSPTLLALASLERQTDIGTASLIAALAITLGALAALALALRRAPAAVGWGLTLAAFVAIGAGAVAEDRATGAVVRPLLAKGPPDWVDRLGGRDVLLIQTRGSERLDAMLTSVLNRTITEARSLGARGIEEFDGLAGTVTLDTEGRLLVGGKPLTRPFILATGGIAATATGEGRTVYERAWVYAEPRTEARLGMLADGVRSSGRLAQRGTLRLFPQADGACTRLSLTLSLPEGLAATTIGFGGDTPRRVTITPDDEQALTWTSPPGRSLVVPFRTERIGTRPPSPFAATVAEVRWSVDPVRCTAG